MRAFVSRLHSVGSGGHLRSLLHSCQLEQASSSDINKYSAALWTFSPFWTLIYPRSLSKADQQFLLKK